MIVMGSLLTRVCVTCGLAGLLAFATGPRSAQADDGRWTLSIQLSTRNANVMAGLVRTLEIDRGTLTVSAWRRTLRIAASAKDIERLVRIIREVDDPDTAGQRIWTMPTRRMASNLAERLDYLAEHDRGWPVGAKIPKFVPDDVGHRVIVLTDEAGYLRIKLLLLEDSRRPQQCDCGPVELPLGPSAR
jgi:hypothetical protein